MAAINGLALGFRSDANVRVHKFTVMVKSTANPGAGPTTLSFTRPPRRLPGYAYEATRHDNIATSGVREAVLERVDQFLELEMEYVALGSDVSAWAAFMGYALRGGQFSYYPDSSLTPFTNYWLED